ncbi:hypothetical protein OIU80_17395, partial [Flavobacterium sp. LS1R47]|nr:hypothetical protein [Flavobacterium frigoritolerans]
MYNCTLKMLNFFKHSFFIVFFLFSTSLFSQICGTPGGDGPITVSSSVNTYYPVDGNITLNAGGQSIKLAAVPKMDAHKNDFGTTPISVGDLILIIQMQDATIDFRNNNNYGSGTSNSGLDLLGGTGFTAIGNTGVFEYVIATNNVLLSGGNLTFKGTGVNGGTSNSYFNADAEGSRGKKTFQIVRVPQYSNLTLTKDITTPPFNGIAGGVIAFNVSGNFNFSNFSINGTARGFRGGYSPKADSGKNNSTTYVGDASDQTISGKGEGIAGTPRFMWDGYNEVNNGVEGMPGGSAGRGAPANAGGGGNDHNSGGGGGGNGGLGGLGGYGWQGAGGVQWSTGNPLTGAGRPGFKSYRTTNPELTRLIMGGGGGAGDANNATNGVKGGVGGAIVLINAGAVIGPGKIEVNGGPGAAGAFQSSSDGAGGAGAGGTVLLNISGATTGGKITINANGGNGGHTDNDTKNEHGPGGGGGGGIIRHNIAPANVVASVIGGLAGLTNGTGSNNHGSMPGTLGYVATFANNEMPPNLQVNSKCFPILDTKVIALPTASACNSIDEKVSYEIQIKNTGVGNAAGVVLDFRFPANIGFDSATAIYSIDASGPSGPLANTATANKPIFGGFNIAQNGVVTITLIGKVTGSIVAGAYSSNAQALYLDPTRTTGNDTRKITAFMDNSGGVGVFTSYQGANQENVPGSNFNGDNTTVDDIKILALPAVPSTSVSLATCQTPTGAIRVTSPANGSGITYTLRGTNPVTAPESNDTGVFTGLAPNTYVVTTTNNEGCTSLPTANIDINAVSGAPITTGASVCQGDAAGASLTVTSSSCSRNNIGWYLDAIGGVAIFTGASFNPFTTLGSGLTSASGAQTKTYYAACPGASSCRTATNFVINAKPTITGITPGSRCDAGTVILEATASAGTINWYDVASGGSSLKTGTSFTTPSLSVSKDYYVGVTDNGCPSDRTLVRATVNTSPTIISTTQASRCGAGEVILKATASAGATINWYASPISESVLETGSEFRIPNLSTTTTYYVGATTAQGCSTTSRIAVAAVINTASSIVFTSGTQNPAVCTATAIPTTVYTFGGSATNAIVTDLPAGLRWDVDPNAKTVTISGTPTTSGTYTITTIGHTTPCVEAIISGTVTINKSIPLPTVSAVTQPTCSTAKGSFTIDNYNSSYIYTISPSAGAVQTGNTVTAPAGSYKVTAKSGTCTSGESAIAVINAQPATPLAPEATKQDFCFANTKKVNDLLPSGTNIKWYNTLTGGTSYVGTELLVTQDYYVSQTTGGCESSRTKVAVIV